MKKVIVLGLILTLLIPALVLVGCGSGGSSSGTPQEVAKAFWTGVYKGDVDSTWAMLSKSLQTSLKNKSEWATHVTSSTRGVTIEVGKATVTGNTATVEVKIMSGGTQVMTSDVQLVKEGGVWKVMLP